MTSAVQLPQTDLAVEQLTVVLASGPQAHRPQRQPTVAPGARAADRE